MGSIVSIRKWGMFWAYWISAPKIVGIGINKKEAIRDLRIKLLFSELMIPLPPKEKALCTP